LQVIAEFAEGLEHEGMKHDASILSYLPILEYFGGGTSLRGMAKRGAVGGTKVSARVRNCDVESRTGT